MITEGPIFDRVEAVIGECSIYRHYCAGELSPQEFAAFLDSTRAELVAGGVPDEDVDYAKRYPADRDKFLRDTLNTLREQGVIAAAEIDPQQLVAARTRLARWDHGDRTTYIYPEEADILAALAILQRPRHVIFLGAYYGYWAGAILPALAESGGRAVLIDPDPDCCMLAINNLTHEIDQGLVEVISTTGEAFVSRPGPDFDMVVIDAEVSRDHPDPGLRGKGVYASLFTAVLPRLNKDALVVCHNILLDDHTGAPALASALERNHRELAAFEALVHANLCGWTRIPSTEGVGVGRRDAQP
jgi:predicted O-methyltransferase YrrM